MAWQRSRYSLLRNGEPDFIRQAGFEPAFRGFRNRFERRNALPLYLAATMFQDTVPRRPAGTFVEIPVEMQPANQLHPSPYDLNAFSALRIFAGRQNQSAGANGFG